ncbi:Protein of unknown function [Hathewaya proteolytica DSM 3090]|uniref:Uncharacterized protein n=1 Tax=Hathewaya proteolytica DSM 3090 TaxID=1121331 RepID=A0A1M6LH01_9CLOT|nr:pilus assembly PilX N-terminal domain-containing protein [Hathewaya proteolytica]SHJ70493.1 Protein of unknown function [Hathewaya proteolytica DSM 3090]
MKQNIHKQKRKGSALIIALISIMLILSLGSVSLAMSLNNMKMAGKVATSNAEYYHLEKAAQKVLTDLDKNLSQAEMLAVKYMKNELYKQTYDYVQYEESVMALTSPEDNHNLIHSIWESEVKDKSVMLDGVTINSVLYSEFLEVFFNQAFNRLYYSYAQKDYNDNKFDVSGITVSNGEVASNAKYYEAYYTASFNVNESKNYKNFKINTVEDDSVQPEVLKEKQKISNLEQWKKFELTPTDFVMDLNVYGCNVENGASALAGGQRVLGTKELKGRMITGNLAIMPPVYEGADSTKYRTVRGNPVYTNAIAAGGSIFINGGTQTINGEIAAANGDIIINSSDTTINGNVSVANNLNIDNNAKLTVNSFGSEAYDIKLSVYKNRPFFYDTDEDDIVTFAISEPKIEQVMEGSPKLYSYTTEDGQVRKCMPFIFNDTKGGNIYAPNVNINNSNNTTCLDTRNLLFSGKVNMSNCSLSKFKVTNLMVSAKDTSSMRIGGNDVKDYTSEINYNNTTEINKGFVGTTFVSRDNEYDEGCTSSQVAQYRSKTPSTSYTPKNTLNQILAAKTKHFGTVNRSVTNLVNTNLLKDTIVNFEEPEAIPKFKLSDTKNWSTANIVKYLPGGTTLDLAGKDFNGIIYCLGNLNLKNSGATGSINGAIICSGNVTINGSIKINYSEDMIKNTFSKAKVVEKFFAPGEMGANYNISSAIVGKDEYVNANARVRKSKDRYIVTKWARSRVK